MIRLTIGGREKVLLGLQRIPPVSCTGQGGAQSRMPGKPVCYSGIHMHTGAYKSYIGEPLEKVQNLKYLGFLFSDMMNFSEHVK